jgi:hypothetical protein
MAIDRNTAILSNPERPAKTAIGQKVRSRTKQDRSELLLPPSSRRRWGALHPNIVSQISSSLHQPSTQRTCDRDDPGTVGMYI